MAAIQQTYKNHVRVDRAYLALMVLNFTDLIAAIWWMGRRFDLHHLVVVGLAIAVLSASFALRHYALVNQNRIIRLEENVRLHWMGADGAGLNIRQMVALRFASDCRGRNPRPTRRRREPHTQADQRSNRHLAP